MVQIASPVVQSPRISANQLGEFVFASEQKRLNILHDQKFGNINAAPYYTAALGAVRRSFINGQFSAVALLNEARLIDEQDTKTPQGAVKLANNSLALRRLAEICGQTNPPAGEHRMIIRNAQLVLEGVTISVLPEFVTENLPRGYIAFTKFRFSKSKIAADVSEIVLLLLHYYGQRQSRTGLTFDFGLSKVVDCFSKTIIPGHAVGRHRDQQLHEALKLICWLWPRIEPKNPA
jgi:hypothetical protein